MVIQEEKIKESQTSTDRHKKIETIMKKKEEFERKTEKQWLINIKMHWWLVIMAILITFIVSMSNSVSIYKTLERCFYSGAAFWIISEIIEMIIKEE